MPLQQNNNALLLAGLGGALGGGQQGGGIFGGLFQTMMRDLLAQKANERIMERQALQNQATYERQKELMLMQHGLDPSLTPEEAAKELYARTQATAKLKADQEAYDREQTALGKLREDFSRSSTLATTDDMTPDMLAVLARQGDTGAARAHAASSVGEAQRPMRSIMESFEGTGPDWQSQIATDPMIKNAAIGGRMGHEVSMIPGMHGAPMPVVNPSENLVGTLRQAEELRGIKPTRREGITPLPEDLSRTVQGLSILNSARESFLKSDAYTMAVDTTRSLNESKMIVEQLKIAQAQGADYTTAVAPLENRLRMTVARMSEPSGRLTDFDVQSATGIENRNLRTTMVNVWNRLRTGQSWTFTEDERDALVMLIEHSGELTMRLAENTREQQIQALVNLGFERPLVESQFMSIGELRKLIEIEGATAGDSMPVRPYVPGQ